MRKILCILVGLLLCVLVGCSEEKGNTPTEMSIQQTTEVETESPTEETVVEQDLSLYKPYVEAALDHHDGMGYYDPLGYLCDVDNNSVQELIMLYTIPDATSPSGDMSYYGDVYSIYTMDSNEVVPLVEEELFFMHAGGPSGEVYLMNEGGKSFVGFCYQEANPGQANEWVLLGDWDFYYIDGAELSDHRNVEYFCVNSNNAMNYSESYITEDSEKSPYKDFENWFNSCDSQKILTSFSENSNNNLELLYEQLG